MSIGLITITHNRIGDEILKTAEDILGSLPVPVRILTVGPDDSPESMCERVRESIRELDQGEGVLILTDLFGSTPCNIAHEAGRGGNVRVVSGVNLPMVLRICNYAHLELPSLASRAADGARTGINDYIAGKP